jgi:hypothetical protein
VTKSEVKNLEKRVRGLDHKTSSTDDAGGARMAWLVSHLTEEERVEGSRCIKRLETDQGDKEAEERMHELLAKAEIRGDTRPASVKEEFHKKHSRAEELRNRGRALTDPEHDELRALNAWFEKFRQEPRTFEEQLEAGRKELENDPELRRAEGLDPVESYADERGGE